MFRFQFFNTPLLYGTILLCFVVLIRPTNSTLLKNDNLLSKRSEYFKDSFTSSQNNRHNCIYMYLKVTDVHSRIKKLNKSTECLHLSIFRPKRHHQTMDIGPIEELLSLSALWIVPATVSSAQVSRDYSIIITFNSTSSKPLNIRELHVNMPLYSSPNLINLIQRLPNLEILDLGGTLTILEAGVLKEILKNLEGKPLQVLSLKTFQNIAFDYAIQNINLTSLLWPLRDSPLRYLDLSGNDILSIAPGFYQVTRYLKVMDLSRNNLVSNTNKAMWVELFIHPSIEVLNVDYQGNQEDCLSSGSPEKITTNASRSRKKRASLGDSPIAILKTCLKRLNLTFNDIVLKKENFCKVIYCADPVSFTGIPCKILPSFQQARSLLDNTCDLGIRIPIAENLKVFSASHLSLLADSESISSTRKLCFYKNKVEKITFDSNVKLNQDLYTAEYLLYYVVDSFDHVKEISLNDNQMNISVESAFFQSLKQLQNLSLSGNFVKTTPNTSFCRYNLLLGNIDISNNQLYSVSEGLVQECSNMKVLDLSRNKLSDVILAFHENSNLCLLNLSHNSIHSFNIEMRNYLKSVANSSNLVVDLSDNPLYCRCTQDSIDTVMFIKNAADYNITFHNIEHYECFAKYSSMLLKNANVDIIRNNCYPSKLYIILSSTISNILVISICISVILMYKYRYRIYTFNLKFMRKCCYKNENVHKENQQLTHDITYDAFVSYSAEDRFWVHGVLMNELEKQYGFKLCIHYRDFPAHGDIADVIVEHIKKSRSIIVILSEYSLQSHWCEFELKNAHTQSLMFGKPFIVIKMGKLPRSLVSGLVEDLLCSQVYIEWPDSNKVDHDKIDKVLLQKQAIFWEKISAATYGISYSQCFKYCCCTNNYVKFTNPDLIDNNDDDLFI